MTALFESLFLTITLDVFSLSIPTFLHFSRVGKPVLDSQGHRLARCTEHLNHSPLQEDRPSLPGTLSDCRESIITCVLTWFVPSSVVYPSCVPCVTAPTH